MRRLEDLGRLWRPMSAEDAHRLVRREGRRRAVPQPVDHQDEAQAVALDRRPVVAADLLTRCGNLTSRPARVQDHDQLDVRGCRIEASPQDRPRFLAPSRFRTQSARRLMAPSPVPGEPADEYPSARHRPTSLMPRPESRARISRHDPACAVIEAPE